MKRVRQETRSPARRGNPVAYFDYSFILPSSVPILADVIIRRAQGETDETFVESASMEATFASVKRTLVVGLFTAGVVVAGFSDRIREAFVTPVLVGNLEVGLGASIGSHRAEPGDDIWLAMRMADAAMYDQKSHAGQSRAGP